jgi:hypothetical protein
MASSYGGAREKILYLRSTKQYRMQHYAISWVPIKVHLPKLWRSKHLFSLSNLEQRSSAISTRYGCYLFLRAIHPLRKALQLRTLSQLQALATEFSLFVVFFSCLLLYTRLQNRLPVLIELTDRPHRDSCSAKSHLF